MELTEVIRRGIITEKTVAMQSPPANQQRRHDLMQARKKTDPNVRVPELTHKYVFEVALTATKIEIRQAVLLMFPEVKRVLKVNTMRMPGKARTVRSNKGFRKTKPHPW